MTQENPNDLIANLLSASLEQTHNVTNRVIENLESEVIYQKALVKVIRHRIESLLNGNYMPTPNAIIDALYPGEYVIDKFKADSAYEN
jgi:hypothetical protein